MASRLLVLLAVAISPAAAASKGAAVTNPLGKVIQLLDSLAAKVTAEGTAEEKAYKEFVDWCDDATTNKGFEIKTATAKKEDLTASIDKMTSEASAATAKIEDLAGTIAASSADLKSCIGIRGKEAAEFTASEAELMDSIDALSRAVTIIERQMQKNPAALAQIGSVSMNNLVQTLATIVDAASFSGADRSKLAALVQQQQNSASDDEDMGPPAAAAYKSKSSSILDVLEDLKEKAEEELGSLRKAESNAAHQYNLLKQSLEDQIAADSKDMTEKKSAKASALENKAIYTGDLQHTTAELSDAESALEVTKSTCVTMGQDHEASVAARTEELKVIADAKKVLSSSTSGAVSQSYSLLQLSGTSATGSQLQTREDLARIEVVTLVKRLAKEHHSAALAQLASRIAATLRFSGAGQDPFGKVKGMIAEMITKLESEAGKDATEKGYCDEQISKTEEKKGELDHTIDKLTSKIDTSTAKLTTLKREVKELQAELATLTSEQAEMDKVRRESHADYSEAKTDLEAGLAGVRQALGMLREYYGSAAAAAAMIQNAQDMRSMMQQPSEPEYHSKASGAGTSIIGLLEVVESDFSKNLSAEEMQEEDAATSYEATSQKNKVTKTMKEQDVTYKTKEAAGLEKSLGELSGDRESAATEMSAVLEYYSKIKERCIAKAETYEQRTGRREAEIAGLKEALTILENDTALMQRGKHSKGRHAFLGISSK
jgi:chromosome segregation ATPase